MLCVTCTHRSCLKWSAGALKVFFPRFASICFTWVFREQAVKEGVGKILGGYGRNGMILGAYLRANKPLDDVGYDFPWGAFKDLHHFLSDFHVPLHFQ